MKSYEMAEDYLKRAGRCLQEAESAFKENDYPMAIRRSQECIELSVKGVLRAVSIEFPREHDVSDVLVHMDWKEIGSPDWFADRVEDMAKIMRDHSKEGPCYVWIREGDEASQCHLFAGGWYEGG